MILSTLAVPSPLSHAWAHFLLLKLGVAGASAVQWVEGRDAATHPTNAGWLHGKQLPGPHISAALIAGNPWSRGQTPSKQGGTVLLLLTVPFLVPAMAPGTDWHGVSRFVE